MLIKLRPALPVSSGPRSARGFSMLETLVTLLIIAIWMLGSAGVQTVAMKLNKSSAMRNQAVLLAAEVGERMENNLGKASVGKYEIKKKVKPVDYDCTLAPCSPDDLAKYDLAEMYKRAHDGGFDLEIRKVKGEKDDTVLVYTIDISWTDRRTGQTYDPSLDPAPNEAPGEPGQYTTTKTVYRTDPTKGKKA